MAVPEWHVADWENAQEYPNDAPRHVFLNGGWNRSEHVFQYFKHKAKHYTMRSKKSLEPTWFKRKPRVLSDIIKPRGPHGRPVFLWFPHLSRCRCRILFPDWLHRRASRRRRGLRRRPSICRFWKRGFSVSHPLPWNKSSQKFELQASKKFTFNSFPFSRPFLGLKTLPEMQTGIEGPRRRYSRTTNAETCRGWPAQCGWAVWPVPTWRNSKI